VKNGFAYNTDYKMNKNMYVGWNPNHQDYTHRVNDQFWNADGQKLNQIVRNLMGGQPVKMEMWGDHLTAINPAEKMAKANIGTGTAAAYNALFNGVSTIQIAQQQNAFGALAKEGYPRAGYRTVSAAAIASGAGIAQAAAIGTAVVPTYQEINVGLKEVEVVTDVSTRLDIIAGKDDVVTFDDNRQTVLSNFMTALDADILVDGNTLASNNLESLDRITASSVEATDQSWDTADEDLYSVDRSGNTWFNGNSDGSTTNRPITTALVNALERDQIDRWNNDLSNKFYLTRTDTWMNWSGLESPKYRISGEMYTNTMAGIMPVPGTAGGFRLNQYSTHPIVVDSQVKQDGAGRIYLIDGNTTKLSMAMPIQYYESGDPFQVGHVRRALWYGIMELRCTLPSANGKLRDLSA